jgi:hypothetical protein
VSRAIAVTIDVLAVSGVDAAQARVFGDSLKRALTELIRTQGLPPVGDAGVVRGSMAVHDIGVRETHPAKAADAVARAIYRGLAS